MMKVFPTTFMFFVVLLLVAIAFGGLKYDTPVPTPVMPTITSTPTAAAIAIPTVTPTVTAAAMPLPPTVTLEPPTPTREPRPGAGGNVTALPLPTNTGISWTGCASDGECHPFNFYWAPTREVVMQPGEPYYKEVHERCHAHQAWAIGRDLVPSEYDLHPWYSTQEGQQFMTEIGIPNPWPFSHSAINGLESFAWVCGFYYADPQQLHDLCLVCYNWARRNLP